MREDWPATALVLFSPGAGSGTASVFADVALSGAPQRGDVATSEDDRVIVQGVQRSPGGVGYVPLGYARAAEDEVRPVAVDAGDGCVAPEAGTVADGTYPMSRALQVYVSAEAHGTRAPVAALVAMLVERGPAAAEEVLVVPPTDEQRDRAEDALEALGPGPG